MNCWIIDAFTDKKFRGNPAAVVPLGHWLPDKKLLEISSEFNLSETAFFLAAGGSYHLRWFTPATEVELCGHATLAAAHVIFRELKDERSSLTFQTQSGLLRVRREKDWIELNFPSYPPGVSSHEKAVAEALGAKPLMVLQASTKLLAVFEQEEQVRALQPDMEKTAALPLPGLIATAPGEKVDFVSRFFAPALGVPEDPVTGSAHTLLTPYWAERLGKEELTAWQVSERGGMLRLRMDKKNVAIAGKSKAFMAGRLT